MSLFDHETHARTLYFLAGAKTGEILTARQLVRRNPAFGLELGVSRGGQTAGCEASLHMLEEEKQWQIRYATWLAIRAADSPILHELAEWLHRHEVHERKEDACNELAVVLASPREAVFCVARYFSGTDVEAAARVFNVSQRNAAIRLAEVTRRPLALVHATSIGFAGPEWGWPPDEDTLRRLASGRRKHPRVTRVGATDERQLTFLFGRD